MSTLTTAFQLSYAPLMHFELVHSFYVNGFCPNIALVPSAACKRELRKHTWEFVQVPNGGKIFSKNGPTNIWTSAAKTANFEFYVVALDGQFLAVTDFPAATAPEEGMPIFVYSYQNGAWLTERKLKDSENVPSNVVGIVRFEAGCHPDQFLNLQLPFAPPQIHYTYFILTGASFSEPIQIAENNVLISSTGAANPDDLAKVIANHPNKRVWPIQIQKLLQRKYPNWYLVQNDGQGGWEPIANLPALPKPSATAAPHKILDYSALLK